MTGTCILLSEGRSPKENGTVPVIEFEENPEFYWCLSVHVMIKGEASPSIYADLVNGE